jgi:hypothetical protein
MDVQDHYSPEYDEGEALWVEIDDFGTVKRYFIDDTFELGWKGSTNTYAVLVHEEDFPNYARGILNFVPDLFRYSDDLCYFEVIFDEDEKAFVLNAIDDFYKSQN